MVVDPVVLTLAVAGGALVLFVTELLPPDITALAAAAALMLLGVLEPSEGFSGFSSEATVTVLSMFILAAGVQRTGLVNVLAHKVLDMAQGRPWRFFLLMVVVAGVFSAFINNTPIVAIFIPLVITVAARLGRSPSRYLIPLSYAAMLGGTMTLIGTSTNVLGSDVSARLGYGAFTMFMFFKIGAILFVIGAVYLLLIGWRLVPERHAAHDMSQRFSLREYVGEVVVEPGSALVGQTVENSVLKRRYDIDIIRIFRGEQAIDQPLIGVELKENDILLVRASREELLNMREAGGLSILPEVTHGLPGESGDQVVVEAIVMPGASIEGATLAETRFRQRFDAVVLAVKKRERLFLRRFQALRLEHGDTLLLAGAPEAIEALKSSRDMVLAQELPVEKFRRHKFPVVLAILAGVVGVASLGWLPISVAALTGVVAMVVSGALKVHELHESVRWDVVFLLAGIIPLGVALEKTGAAADIAMWVTARSAGLEPWIVLGIFYVFTMLLTQLISNNAAVVLMIPIAAQAAVVLGLNPLAFILGVTFAASMGFLTPIGYQTNLMVYGPGEYRFMDFVRVGAPLSVLMTVVNVYLLMHFCPLTAAACNL